jgi:cation transport regulator ChaC
VAYAGYGSLIEKESRKRTTPEAEDARPAVVEGVSRGWWDRTPSIGFTTTFLGAVLDGSARCNGVVYPVTPEQLAKTDERESGYDRKPIPVDKVAMLDGSRPDPAGRYWIYLSRTQQDATPEVPIVQSYVDICINGCIEVEADYALAR